MVRVKWKKSQKDGENFGYVTIYNCSFLVLYQKSWRTKRMLREMLFSYICWQDLELEYDRWICLVVALWQVMSVHVAWLWRGGWVLWLGGRMWWLGMNGREIVAGCVWVGQVGCVRGCALVVLVWGLEDCYCRGVNKEFFALKKIPNYHLVPEGWVEDKGGISLKIFIQVQSYLLINSSNNQVFLLYINFLFFPFYL